MKKNFNIHYIITASIFFIGIILIFLSVFYLPTIHKNQPVPINVYILENKPLDYKLDSSINKSIEDNIEKLYNKNISHLNTSIILFSTWLGIFGIVFGIFYFLKINQLQKELEKMKNVPEEVFKKFYRQQLKINIDKLLSDNNITRSAAIRSLYTNTEITINDFDIIKTVFEKEVYSNNNISFYTNIQILIYILFSIEKEKTTDLLIKILNEVINAFKFNNLITYLFINDNKNVDNFILEHIKSENQNMTNILISSIANNNLLDKYAIMISEHGSNIAFNTLISYSSLYKISNLSTIILNRENIIGINFHGIISSPNITNGSKARIILKLYSLNKDNNILLTYLNSIKESIPYKIEFEAIHKKEYNNLNLDDFFKEYNNFLKKSDFIKTLDKYKID